jgi:hypothetical protein
LEEISEDELAHLLEVSPYLPFWQRIHCSKP